MSKVLLIGATGVIGTRVVAELLSRGHEVIALVRDPAKLPVKPGLTVIAGDASNTDDVAKAAVGADAIISSFGAGNDSIAGEKLLQASHAIIAGAGQAGVRRLLVVGGAGSLEIAPGVQVVDAPGFPEVWKPIALAHREVLNTLRGSGLDWTYFSPAALIQPGQRTGKFRLGADQLIADASGQSFISTEDYAIALVDEIEQGRHIGKRFTIGY